MSVTDQALENAIEQADRKISETLDMGHKLVWQLHLTDLLVEKRRRLKEDLCKPS